MDASRNSGKKRKMSGYHYDVSTIKMSKAGRVKEERELSQRMLSFIM